MPIEPSNKSSRKVAIVVLALLVGYYVIDPFVSREGVAVAPPLATLDVPTSAPKRHVVLFDEPSIRGAESLTEGEPVFTNLSSAESRFLLSIDNTTTNNTYVSTNEINGTIIDENLVEDPLPPLDAAVQVRLAEDASRIFNDEATMGITVTIGVLTAPALLRTRLIPLLESSLKYERDVHVFFMDDPKTLKGRNALRSYLESVNRTGDVHIALLPPPLNMSMQLRNAWVNLPAIKYFREQRPEQRWFAIMDDDTYFLMNAIRKILRDAELNTTLDDQPVYMGAPITDGLRGGCRVIRTGTVLRVQQTTNRKEVKFVCGGSGILFNQLVIRELHKKNATGFVQVDHCIDMMFAPAGDVRLGHCIAEMNISIVARREMFRDTLFRAVGEKESYKKYRFPASFHRFRRREWQYALRSVEDARDRNELVTWDDLRKNFAPGPIYWRSMFFPEAYENYTTIMGIRKKTEKEIRREKLIWKRFQCGRKKNTDEW